MQTCGLGLVGASNMGRAVTRGRAALITTLNMSRNELDCQSIHAIQLRGCPALTDLNMSGNAFQSTGAGYLA